MSTPVQLELSKTTGNVLPVLKGNSGMDSVALPVHKDKIIIRIHELANALKDHSGMETVATSVKETINTGMGTPVSPAEMEKFGTLSTSSVNVMVELLGTGLPVDFAPLAKLAVA